MLLKRLSIFLSLLVCFGACKKDLLHFRSIQQLDSKTTTDRLNRILFIDNNTGFIVGGQRFYTSCILKTTDGGLTWTRFSFPEAGKCLYGIVASPAGTIYTVGFDGKILSSGDQGTKWNFFQSDYRPFSDISFFDDNHGVIVGGVSFNEGYRVLVDSNAYIIKKDSIAWQLNRVKMATNNIGYICGFGLMQKTTDGGRTWGYINVPGNDNFVGIDIHSENDLWVCGYGGSIFHSIDGGNSWYNARNANDFTIPQYNLWDVVFNKNNINGWAVGEHGLLIYTDDGGHHWEQYERFTDNALRSIVICPNGDLLVAGDNGALYRLKL